MSSFTLSEQERSCLLSLLGMRTRLVWDINAVYLVAPLGTVKVEAVTDVPVAGTWVDVAYLHVSTGQVRDDFPAPAPPPFAYDVIDGDALVEAISIVRTTVLVPDDRIQSPLDPVPPGAQAFATDCGALIATPRGILPAVQFRNTFGFCFLAEHRFYQDSEVDALLGNDYEIEPLGKSAA